MTWSISSLLAVTIGGGAGCLVRYLVSMFLGWTLGTSFPFGTLTVNAAGCFMMGLAARSFVAGDPWRLAIMIGFLGGMTTFSSFALELFLLFEQGRWSIAVSYGVVTQVLCVALLVLGWHLAHLLQGKIPLN
jgi:fluoride exporter